MVTSKAESLWLLNSSVSLYDRYEFNFLPFISIVAQCTLKHYTKVYCFSHQICVCTLHTEWAKPEEFHEIADAFVLLSGNILASTLMSILFFFRKLTKYAINTFLIKGIVRLSDFPKTLEPVIGFDFVNSGLVFYLHVFITAGGFTSLTHRVSSPLLMNNWKTNNIYGFISLSKSLTLSNGFVFIGK